MQLSVIVVPHGGPGWSSWLLIAVCASPGCCSHLESVPVDGITLSVFHSLFALLNKMSLSAISCVELPELSPGSSALHATSC